ncbi:MAG: hypothetical protein GTO24_16665, partial [candidate division Zixibacteria bacterium]|nr:hypothetical protein [candidate division Zixibacteria bacterium]
MFRKQNFWVSKLRGILLSICLFTLTCAFSFPEARAAELFFDGFESGDFIAGGWEKIGCSIDDVHVNSGSFAARFDRGDAIMKALSTENQTGIIVSYYRLTQQMLRDDRWFSEWYDGSDWHLMEEYRGGEDEPYTLKTFLLDPQADDNPNFRIRFRQGRTSFPARVYLDDVVVSSSCTKGCDSVYFPDGFEDAETFEDLFPPDGSRWWNFTRDDGNMVDLDRRIVHTGDQSLKCEAQPGGTKADIIVGGGGGASFGRFPFGRGSEFFCEIWFYIVGRTDTENVFFLDIEDPDTCTGPLACPMEGSGRICKSPGRRLYLSGSGRGSPGDYISSDLGKWCEGENFFQDPDTAIPILKDRWVRIRVYMLVHDDPEIGRMKVWQDDDLVLDHIGQTLPRGDSILQRFEIGATANGN